MQLAGLGRAQFPALTFVSASLGLEGIQTSVEFQQLRSAGALVVSSTQLESLVFGSLVEVGSVRVESNPKLHQLVAPRLDVSADFRVSNNSELEDLTGLASLSTVRGLVSISGNKIAKSAFRNVSGVVVDRSEVNE